MEDLTNDLGNPISYPTKIDDNSFSHLEQNHTTFLLVDNGQIAETNEPKDDMIQAAIEYRVNFEVGWSFSFSIVTAVLLKLFGCARNEQYIFS